MQTYICEKLAQSDPTFAYVQCVQTPCQKPAMTAYLILVIFYIFMNTNMCHGCHSIFYNANFRDYLVIAFWKEIMKYKTKIARREVLL